MSVVTYIVTEVLPAFIGGILGALAVHGIYLLWLHIKDNYL